MSQRAKLRERLRRNPKNVRFEEIDNLLIGYGFTQRSKKHYVFTYGKYTITIRRDKHFIHRNAVIEVIEILDELFPHENDD